MTTMRVENLMALLEGCPADADVRIAVPLYPGAGATIVGVSNPSRGAQLRGDLAILPGRVWILAALPIHAVDALVWSGCCRIKG